MEIIHAYTRKQALADGVLVDVTGRAKEAGFRVPVAVTSAVWAECVAVPDGAEDQDEAGRLWDVLWMCSLHARAHRSEPEIRFRLYVKAGGGELELVTLKAAIGPDDEAIPCVTIMLPDED